MKNCPGHFHGLMAILLICFASLFTSSAACSSLEHTLTNKTGVIVWAQDEQVTCNQHITWTVQVPPHHGVKMQPHQVVMRRSDKIRVYALTTTSDEVVSKTLVTTWKGRDEFYLPLVLTGAAMLQAETSGVPSNLSPLSSINISYVTYPLNNLPQEIDDISPAGSSTLVYNCSTGSPVPEVFRCDGVEQCLGREDEQGCPYTQQGCGNWVPYNDHCLKIEISRSFYHHPGVEFPTMPLPAEKTCLKKYGAVLARLPNDAGLRLAGSLIQHSGALSATIGLRKVKPVSKRHKHLYRYLWQWGPKGSPISYSQTHIQRKGVMLGCSVLVISPTVHVHPLKCFMPDNLPGGYVCMRPNPDKLPTVPHQPVTVHLPAARRRVSQVPTKQCADGSLVQTFHRCQWKDDARYEHESNAGGSPHHLPLFQCQYGPPVHYTLVCDGRTDCVDGSDEVGCLLQRFVHDKSALFLCGSGQVIAKSRRCDTVVDCLDDSDEADCVTCSNGGMCLGVGCVPDQYIEHFDDCTYDSTYMQVEVLERPALPIVQLDGHGMSIFRTVENESVDTEGFFLCGDGNYIPSFLLNNGEMDCLHGEDENIPFMNLTCPGYYRCQYSGHCVHADLVCDGIAHCPHKDDERYCDLAVPPNCTCEGSACSCRRVPAHLHDYLHLRYLDLTGVPQPFLGNFHVLKFLQFLNVSLCHFNNVTLAYMPQLRILDLSYNALTTLLSSAVGGLTGVTHLNVSGNPLVSTLDSAFSVLLTRAGLTSVQHLTMTSTHLRHVKDKALSALTQLTSLDISNNEIETYGRGVFRGLVSLQRLHTDNPKLCCSLFHSTLAECWAPQDELSSCSDLLRHDVFRIFFWTVSLMAAVGNMGTLLSRGLMWRETVTSAHRILVSQLSAADLLMAVYMMIVGIADALFRGSYVAYEVKWKRSNACVLTGVLAFVSSEVSSLMICLITLDRLLKLRFPLRHKLHLCVRSCCLLCGLAWVLGVCLAALPLLAQLNFYGESAICLPLPITRAHFSGHTYSFAVFIVLNFVLFFIIGAGQLVIYWSVSQSGKDVRARHREQDATIARRLLVVVLTNFCCWFPVGLLGLMAVGGISIPADVTVWVAVFVLPVNSALNPFLYTLTGVLERRKKERVQQKVKRILLNIQSEIPKLPPSVIEEIILTCVRNTSAIKANALLRLLSGQQNGTVTNTSSDATSVSAASITHTIEIADENN